MLRPAITVLSDRNGYVRPARVGELRFLDAADTRANGITIGRLRGELLVRWSSMQRRMCRVWCEGSAAFVGEINDRGGVFVNGIAIPRKTKRHALAAGDLLAFGAWGATQPGCPVTIRFDVVDDDLMTRLTRVGEWLVMDAGDVDEPGERRAFKSGCFAHLVTTTGEATPWSSIAGMRHALPPILAQWSDGDVHHCAFAWDGGVQMGRLLERLGQGAADPPLAARLLLDVTRAISSAWDGAGIAVELWDLHVGWNGAVAFLPRAAAHRGPEPNGNQLAAIFRQLVPGDPRHEALAPRDNFDVRTFDEVDAVARDFATEVGAAVDDAALADLVRSACPDEHQADAILREQLALLGDSPP